MSTIEALEADFDRLTAAIERLKIPERVCGREASIDAFRMHNLRRDLQGEVGKVRVRLAHARKIAEARAGRTAR